MAKTPTKSNKPVVEDVLPAEKPQVPNVFGYRELHPDVIGLINDHKVWEEQLLRRFDWLYHQPGVEKRTLAVAEAHLGIAFAMLNKAVANPGRLALTDEMAQMINPDC